MEQSFSALQPNTPYTLALSNSLTAPFSPDYQINIFTTDQNGKYAGQSTGLIKTLQDNNVARSYQQVIPTENENNQVVLVDNFNH